MYDLRNETPSFYDTWFIVFNKLSTSGMVNVKWNEVIEVVLYVLIGSLLIFHFALNMGLMEKLYEVQSNVLLDV